KGVPGVRQQVTRKRQAVAGTGDAAAGDRSCSKRGHSSAGEQLKQADRRRWIRGRRGRKYAQVRAVTEEVEGTRERTGEGIGRVEFKLGGVANAISDEGPRDSVGASGGTNRH